MRIEFNESYRIGDIYYNRAFIHETISLCLEGICINLIGF